MADRVDVIVIGAGVIGLAVGRALAQSGRAVVVIDRHDRVGQETSSRNSGVIHSGIYYPTGSLKAKLCVRGRELLYRYCAERGIAHRRTGKIVVAQQDQIAALEALRQKAVANGVYDLQWLSGAEVAELEPLVRCAAGLLSPATGIIDVHEYLVGLWGDLERAQGTVVFGSEVSAVSADGDGLTVTVDGGAATVSCRWLVNAGGLHAIGLLRRIVGYPPTRCRTAHFAKGNYFAYRGGKPFSHLVYPMPDEHGLGVHATLDLDGTTRFGPDVEWIDEPHYDVDPVRADSFYHAIRQYWPTIPSGSLHPAYAGVRPKLVGAGASAADFVIEDESTHTVPGLINLLGMESPGLTASLAVAEQVLQSVSEERSQAAADRRA